MRYSYRFEWDPIYYRMIVFADTQYALEYLRDSGVLEEVSAEVNGQKAGPNPKAGERVSVGLITPKLVAAMLERRLRLKNPYDEIWATG